MINSVTRWFEITPYNEKYRYLSQTKLKLRGFIDTLDQWKSRMTKYQNLLVMSS